MTKQNFQIGDQVRVSEDYVPHELWYDDIGEVVRYEFDGYIVVKWDWLEEGWIEEEFHWTELQKVTQ